MRTKPKAHVKAVVKVNAYEIICTAVEGGVRGGYHRAYKHTDAPDEDAMCVEMYNYVMNALCEVLVFE